MAVSAPPSLPVGRKVDVRLPYVGTLPATVEASTAEKLLVTLAVADPRVKRLDGSEVAVESTTERGIQRFSGTLKLHPAPRAARDQRQRRGRADPAPRVGARRPPPCPSA